MKFFRILRAMLREIFEEAAYERFCVREGVALTSASYAKFLRESEQARPQKARCC
jgi:hypothetical protein